MLVYLLARPGLVESRHGVTQWPCYRSDAPPLCATLGSHFWIQSPSTDSWGLVFVGSRLRHWWNVLHEIDFASRFPPRHFEASRLRGNDFINLWDGLGTALESLWDRFWHMKVTFGAFRGHFEVTLSISTSNFMCDACVMHTCTGLVGPKTGEGKIGF